MKTRRKNYSASDNLKKEGTSKKKELSIKGRNNKKANLTQSIEDHDINTESTRVKQSKRKQIKRRVKQEKADDNVESFPSSYKRNKSVNKRSRSLSKKENDTTVREKEESVVRDVFSEKDAHLKFEEGENLDDKNTPYLRKRHLRSMVKSYINNNMAENLKSKISKFKKQKEITKHHKEDKRISQEDKYVNKSNDNFKTKLDLPIKTQKGINQEHNEDEIIEESEKVKKNIMNEASKKRKNVKESDIENFKKKTDLSDINIEGNSCGKQENSANDLFIAQDRSEISSSFNKKTKKEENKVKHLDEINYGRRKINIQGIIIEEIETFDADKFCVESKGNSESGASEKKETLSKTTKIKNTVHDSGFNDDQFFIDNTPSLSLLNNTVNKSQLKQCDEIENEIQYHHKKIKSHSVFDDDHKTFKKKSIEKHTNVYDKNITNELEKGNDNICGKDGMHESNQEPDKDHINKSDDDNICGKDGMHESNQEPDKDHINKSNDDSDSTPEIESFQSSRNKALNSMKNAEDEVRKMKLQTKKLRRKHHERNFMQKEQKKKKMLNLEAKKLPQNILDEMAMLEKSKYSSENAEETLPKKPRFSSENNKGYSIITNDGTQEEFISIHGNTEFMVCRANSFIKKQTTVAESAKNWKRQQLFGNKNRRESVKDMMSKKIKQSFCGKVLPIQSRKILFFTSEK